MPDMLHSCSLPEGTGPDGNVKESDSTLSTGIYCSLIKRLIAMSSNSCVSLIGSAKRDAREGECLGDLQRNVELQ